MNYNQPRFPLISYAGTRTYYKNSYLIPIIHLYILVCIYIRRYLFTHTYIKSCPLPIIHLYNLLQSYIRRYLCAFPSPAQKKYVIEFIKTYPGYIIFSTNISGWRSAPSDRSGWVSAPSDLWRNWKPESIVNM